MGLKVRDRVLGFSGVATSVSYDLYGCVQAYVIPSGVGKDGKIQDGAWFDTHRLEILSEKPVMDQPEFAKVKGGQTLPKPSH